MDDRLLAAAREASARIRTAQREVDAARAGFQRTIRALYLDGGSLREIADALELSHQRVHQLLGLPAAGQPAGRQRRGATPCSFCGRSQAEVVKLIAGAGGVAICDACTELAQSSLTSGEPAWSASVTVAVQPAPGRCPFCGKHTGAGQEFDSASPIRLITAPGSAGEGAICEECLELSAEIIAETT